MGCSASRSGSHDFISPRNSRPGSHSTPVPRSLSLPSRPAVHHPALTKGDSTHLVVLTSTTYGSLLLIDRPEIPNPDLGCARVSTEPISPDSVVNTWELMEGLEDNENSGSNSALEFVEHSPKGGREDRIVVYYTSLRGIRKTYEDCCDVRMIFRGFRVCVDERDISMDSSYREELQGVLGRVSLPQVFIRGRHIGGADEIKGLNEAGELEHLLKGFPVKQEGTLWCRSCEDTRFLPCPSCRGSRKVFAEEEMRLRRCQDCNENGLVRCPGCLP
ncbi:hypothetical protein DM860_000965 [Cuscuta australis]|uniref:Glutaredoxin domain-containing protein n=1 Tax=Cuscuta australis TaxID=267555 RepID=A0A328DSH4_9ASTE|nr:hypothetical protein DM860_000965 [Cuscuta australis]